MAVKQLILLLFTNITIFSVGNALLPLVPIRAMRLGADATAAGLYLALAFAALATGTMVAGPISSRLRRRRALIAAAAIANVPTLVLAGQANNVILLGLLVALVWFLVGIQLAMTAILTAVSVDKRQLGRAFGIIGAGPAFGQIISGVLAGPIADRWGFAAVYTVFAGVAALPILIALLIDDRQASPSPLVKTQTMEITGARNLGFLMLLISCVLMNTANFIAVTGKPLAMDALNFDAAAVTSTVAISGAVSLPVPLLLGWLSDRWGRQTILQTTYAMAALGVGLLAIASQLWHFWLSQSLLTLAGAGMAAGSALVAEMVPARQMNTAVSRYHAMPWIGGVIGCAIGGASIGAIGPTLTFTVGAALPIAAIVLLGVLRAPKPVRPAPAVTSIRATQH